MSIYTITIDDLMQLDKDALAYALRTFQKELDGMLDLLGDAPDSRRDEVVLSDLTHALTLRKVLTRRLAELEAMPSLPELSTALAAAA